jgi:hypothetical protein
VEIDTSGWSGEGAFTQVLIDVLRGVAGIAAVRVEDAPATRSDADYNFISNEFYLNFERRIRVEPARLLGFIPGSRRVQEKTLSLEGLESMLAAIEGVGPADYADPGMIQYLRTERIVPPYQTRGYKVVELIRLYEMGTEPSR